MNKFHTTIFQKKLNSCSVIGEIFKIFSKDIRLYNLGKYFIYMELSSV